MYDYDWFHEWDKKKIRYQFIALICGILSLIWISIRFYTIGVVSFFLGLYIGLTALQSHNWFMIFVGFFILIIGTQYSIRKNLGLGV